MATVDGLDNLFEDDTGAVSHVRGDSQATLDTTADTIVSWTLNEAANNLRLSTRTVLRKLKAGTLQGRKVIGANGPEWRIQPIDTPDMTNNFIKVSVRGVTSDNQATEDSTLDRTVQALLNVIENQTKQIDVSAEQLKAASQVIMYQKSQLENKEQQLKLLTDSQHKAKWWQRLGKWFVGTERAD